MLKILLIDRNSSIGSYDGSVVSSTFGIRLHILLVLSSDVNCSMNIFRVKLSAIWALRIFSKLVATIPMVWTSSTALPSSLFLVAM